MMDFPWDGYPYRIVSWCLNVSLPPQEFGLLNLDAAIDAARAIYRDDSIARVEVVDIRAENLVVAVFHRVDRA